MTPCARERRIIIRLIEAERLVGLLTFGMRVS
jgi:hypothetical protein